MVGAFVIVLCVWLASAAMFFRLASPARTPQTRVWRFAPVLTMGFAIPIAAAYSRADWSTFTSLLVAVILAFGALLLVLRPAPPTF